VQKPILFALTLAFAFSITPASAADREAPDTKVTPGRANPKVTQGNIRKTICQPAWVEKTRAAAGSLDAIKVKQLEAQGGSPRDPKDYVADHIIPIEVGGHPTDPRNLWPQSQGLAWNVAVKDKLEAFVNREVCEGRMKLKGAQTVFKNGWVDSFHLYCGAKPDAPCRPPGSITQLKAVK